MIVRRPCGSKNFPKQALEILCYERIIDLFLYMQDTVQHDVLQAKCSSVCRPKMSFESQIACQLLIYVASLLLIIRAVKPLQIEVC